VGLWGGIDVPAEPVARAVGRGAVHWGGALCELEAKPGQVGLYPAYAPVVGLLGGLGVPPDFECEGPLRHTHRRTDEREIYFVANRTDADVDCVAVFRVARGTPELWDPLTGAVRALGGAEFVGDRTSVRLRFEAFGSGFVVFPTSSGAAVAPREGLGVDFAELRTVTTIGGPWDVRFDEALGGPAEARFAQLQDWTQRQEPGIRYYSGIGVYRASFDLPAGEGGEGATWFLDLGEVHVMARVRVNGVDCGTVWTAPWRVDITKAVRERGNTLEIEVANLWPNRMIGDAAEPKTAVSRTTYRPFKAGDALLPSGLLGPVTVSVAAAR